MPYRMEVNDVFEEGESRVARGIVVWEVGEWSIPARIVASAEMSGMVYVYLRP